MFCEIVFCLNLVFCPVPQVLPYFVVNKLGHLHGLPGLFTACLYAGALRYVRERNNEEKEEGKKEEKGKKERKGEEDVEFRIFNGREKRC